MKNEAAPTVATIEDFITKQFPGLIPFRAWGELSFFYNPDASLPRGIYFCTLKEKDGENDAASDLNRTNVFRINFGISKTTFISLFKEKPKRPAKGGVIVGSYDFTALDTLTPHPVYGWMSWVSILNPTKESWVKLVPLLKESYELAQAKWLKRTRNK